MKIKTRRYYIYFLAKFGLLIIRMLPIRLLSCIGRQIGLFVYYFDKKIRALTVNNLKSAFRDKSEKEIKDMAKGVFSHCIMAGCDFVASSRLTDAQIVKWIKPQGIERLYKVLEKGKGAIILTAHLGNWELLAQYVTAKKILSGTIAKKLYFSRYEDILYKMRTQRGFTVFYREEPMKKVLRFLRKNGILGILADQDIDSIDGVFVNFFGKPAYTPVGPVKIANKTGAALVQCYVIKEKNGYTFQVGDPIYVKDGKLTQDDIVDYTQRWTNVLESYIRKYPEQWVWMHDRWKTKKGSV